MSTQRKPEFIEEEISEQAVREYLEANPDFFEHHSALLDSLELPHAAGGAVSLVERQVSMLRQKELKMQRQLNELVDVARDNDRMSSKIHEMTLQLLAANDLQATISVLEEAMRSGFGADHAVLVVFGDPEAFARGTRDRLAASVSEPECLGASEIDGKSAVQYRFFSKPEPNEHGSSWMRL